MRRPLLAQVLCLALLLLGCAQLHAEEPKTKGSTASEANPTTGSLVVHGHLVDSSGTPLAGWGIHLFNKDRETLCSETTKPDGTFDFSIPSGGPYFVVLHQDSDGTSGTRQFQRYVTAPLPRAETISTLTPFRLDKRSRTITGRVVTREDKRPLAHAEVMISDSSRTRGVWPAEKGCVLDGTASGANTDLAGRFVLAGVPGNAMLATSRPGLELTVRSEGAVPFSLALDKEQGIPDDLGVIEVEGGCTLSGRLLDGGTREPVKMAGRDFTAFCGAGPLPEQEVRCTITPDDAAPGRFRIGRVPPATLVVSIRSPHFQPKTIAGVEMPGQTLDLGDVLVERWPSGDAITGRALDGVTGKPFPDGVEVRLGWTQSSMYTYKSGEFHKYELKGIPGRPVFGVDGHVPKTVSPVPPPNEAGLVDFGDLVFDAGETLTGVVTDDQGSPLPETYIRASLSTSTWVWSSSAKTDRAGRFAMTGFVAGETYKVSASNLEYNYLEKTVTVSQPPETQFVLQRHVHESVTFRGRLMDLFGHGLAGWRIDDTLWREVVTDENGRFRLPSFSPKGQALWFAKVKGGDSDPNYLRFGTRELKASEGERNVVLPFGPVIRGRLLYADGERVTSGSYTLERHFQDGRTAAETTATCSDAKITGPFQTDLQGGFSIGPVPTGLVRLVIGGPTYSTKTFDTLQVEAAPEVQIGDLVVERTALVGGHLVDPRVTGTFAQPDFVLQITCLDELGRTCGYGTTMHCISGGFLVGQIPVQTRSFLIVVKGYAPRILRAPGLVSQHETDLGTVELERALIVRVRLADTATGKPYVPSGGFYVNLRITGRIEGAADPYNCGCRGYPPPLPLVFENVPASLQDARVVEGDRLLVKIGPFPKAGDDGIIDLGEVAVSSVAPPTQSDRK